MNRNILALILAMTVAVGVGCATNDGGPRSITTVSVDRDARTFWSNHNVAPFDKSSGKVNVAIGQFVVEFVEERVESRPSAGGNDGFTIGQANFGEGMKMELPGMLYEYLHQTKHMELIPVETIAANPTYATLVGTRMGQCKIQRRLASPASDCGVPKAVADYTVDGLRIIDPSQVDLEKKVVAIMKELNADVMLGFWLRVGVYEGKATIEDGSVISVTRIVENDKTCTTYFGNLEAVKTLMGKDSVLDGTPVVSENNVMYYVDSEKFRREIGELFLAYIKMAAVAAH